MNPTDRTRLTSVLRDHVAKIAADLRVRMRSCGTVRERAQRLHADEQVGEDFEVWTDLLSRRAAVLWVLKSVYVRVLEDRGLLAPGRLLDREAQQLFERLAPNLGETAFLQWVYRDLASPNGGLPELFSVQPAEVALPSDDLSRALIAFWRHRDPDSGACWSFSEEHFEGELMGDLYQELDPVVKDRFALCQTPDFVRGFILDRTLTPAMEEFGADVVRLLDPACGSGHFLIDGLKRIVEATGRLHPAWEGPALVAHCLNRVVGIDLNDYACALARARLVMTAAELAGVATLAEAAQFHPHVYWADGLEQVERGRDTRGQQLELFAGNVEEAPRASWTRPTVRAALARVLAPKFHAVVANPPYIVERDEARKAYHREKVGKGSRYVSAYRQYSLASPFTERSFQVAVTGGFVGLITSNNFMKREFGRALIEQVLTGVDLTLVVDTSQAHIPHHGTATVMLFGRARRPVGDAVRAVMGKRGEPARPADPARGRVWLSIAEGWGRAGFENEFVSVTDLPRATLAKHPWSLGGGGAAELRERLEAGATNQVANVCETPIGRAVRIAEEEVFFFAGSRRRQARIPDAEFRGLLIGERVRDWAGTAEVDVWYPYSDGARESDMLRRLWRWKTTLANRSTFQGVMADAGLQWYEYMQHTASAYTTPLSIAYAEIATHNHFVLDRGGKVFKQTAPVIKLPPTAGEDDHLALLGVLNASTACFWMKQVFFAKAAGGIGRGLEPEPWMERYVHDATKLRTFPLPRDLPPALPYARALDALARSRSDASVLALLADPAATSDARTLRAALDARRISDLAALHRMVALQEELDWLCYGLYGLVDGAPLLGPEDAVPVPPTHLPWVLNLAERDRAVRDAVARGDDPGETPTAWFERHRWTPILELPPDAPDALRAVVAERRRLTQENPALALIECATFKRRWYCPDYAAEEQAALEAWLADAVEVAARGRERAFTLEQIGAALQADARVLAVAEVRTGRRDFLLSHLIAQVFATDSVPCHPTHRYKPTGLAKRAAWEKTWEDQRREDAGENVTPEVPPEYGSADFLKNEYWQLRGKLDVPKERFIAFTEVPTRNGTDTLYGWAGWTPQQRLKALLAIDEDLEDGGVPLADRIGLLDSAWRLLPDVARDDPAAANRLKAELQALVGPNGPSREMLDDWCKRSPPPGARRNQAKKKGKSPQENGT